MSLSEAPAVKITYSTAQNVSDEILGGVIQFCQETGYRQSILMLTFFWSAFLLNAHKELQEQDLLKNVLSSYTQSLNKVFPELLQETDKREKVNELCQHYWNSLSSNFTTIKAPSDVSQVIAMANDLNNTNNIAENNALKTDPFTPFSRISGIITSNVYSILRQIDNDMAIQYRGVLDHLRFSKTSTQPTPPKPNKTAANIWKGIGSFFLGIMTAECILLILLGDSVEGTIAFLLTLLVGIPFSLLFFFLFSLKRNDASDVTPPASQANTATPSIQQQSYTTSNPSTLSFCWNCGTKLTPQSAFCHNCGTKLTDTCIAKDVAPPSTKMPFVEKLAAQTVALPNALRNNNEESYIIKNHYTYCDAVIFAEFFIRATTLGLSPSKEIAQQFSNEYVDGVINQTINFVPNANSFFADMFYSRIMMYESIWCSSEDPTKDIMVVLSHIINQEAEENRYIKTDNKNYRYYGGLIENLTITTELATLLQNIYANTAMKDLQAYFESL